MRSSRVAQGGWGTQAGLCGWKCKREASEREVGGISKGHVLVGPVSMTTIYYSLNSKIQRTTNARVGRDLRNPPVPPSHYGDEDSGTEAELCLPSRFYHEWWELLWTIEKFVSAP